MNTNKLLLFSLLGAFVLIGILYFKINSTSGQKSTVKTFSLVLKNYQYQPSFIKVNKNDQVVLNIINQDAITHALRFPQYNVSETIPPSGQKEIRFIASQAGTGSCSTDHGETLSVNVL